MSPLPWTTRAASGSAARGVAGGCTSRRVQPARAEPARGAFLGGAQGRARLGAPGGAGGARGRDDHASGVADAPLYTLPSDGLARWVHVRTVSKFLGTDLRWAAAACDPTTLARHDGRMLVTSGWGSHLLQETVYGLMTHDGTRALVARARETYSLRRNALLRELERHGIPAQGASGMNVRVPVPDESAVVNGLRSYGWWVAAGPAVADLRPADAVRLTSDFATVLVESEATYGG